MMEQKELCIRCGKPTPYDINTPITLRRYFVEGSGQLCPLCWQELYGVAGSLGVPFGTGLPQTSDKATLGEIVELLHKFHDFPADFIVPRLEAGSFEKKLHEMYLSYLLKDQTIFDYKMNCDDRGSFTELIRTPDRGQVSINISKPGITKGQHWHDCKNEIFIVVKRHGLIQMRNLKDNEVEEYEVSGDRIQGVWMKPGWTHNIINLSDTEDLVTVMWASEMLDKERTDTFFEKV